MGRRILAVDTLQIKRFHKMKRHAAQVLKSCTHKKTDDGKCPDPLNRHPKHRQTLLQWAYDPFI